MKETNDLFGDKTLSTSKIFLFYFIISLLFCNASKP